MGDLKAEFCELFKASGWSQAEAARKLMLTRGGFNGLISGPTVPSPGTLKLFKLVLLQEKPEVMVPLGGSTRSPRPTAGVDALVARASQVVAELGSLMDQLKQAVEAPPSAEQAEGARPAPTAPAQGEALRIPEQKISTAETLPGVSPKVADGLRGGAVRAMRMVRRQKGQGSGPSGTTASPT